MIRNFILCMALIAAQVAGQSVCSCQIGEHEEHDHASHMHSHAGHCQHGPVCPACSSGSDSEHHDCKCQNGKQRFIAERANAIDEGSHAKLAVVNDGGFERLYSPDQYCEVLTNWTSPFLGGEFARALWGLWLL